MNWLKTNRKLIEENRRLTDIITNVHHRWVDQKKSTYQLECECAGLKQRIEILEQDLIESYREPITVQMRYDRAMDTGIYMTQE